MSVFRISSSDSIPPDWKNRIDQGLRSFNREAVGYRDWLDLALSIQDEEGQVLGGLIGATIWDMLMIESLWLHEDLRGKGYGHALLARAEEIALVRGCTRAMLETYSWQALPFYEAHGYRVYGQLDDFPVGHSRYCLHRSLLTEMDNSHLAGPPLGQMDAMRVMTPMKEAEEQSYHEILHRLTLDLLNKTSTEDLLHEIVVAASAFLDAPFGEIMLLEGDVLVVRAFTGNQPYLLGDRVGRGDALVSWRAVDSRLPVVLDDYSGWMGQRPLYERAQLRAVADFPVLIGERCIGVLAMARTQKDYPFRREDVARGMQFARLAALLIEQTRARESAQSASDYKSELLGRVSHELRTPLGAILGFAELIELQSQRETDEQLRSHLRNIIEQSIYLSRLIDDLIDVAEMDQGRLGLQMMEILPAELLAEALMHTQDAVELRGLTLRGELDPALPARLMGDRKRLLQIMTNLLSNAVKYSAVGSVTLRLMAASPGRWIIEVSDSGQGISESHLERIFDPFWREEGSTKAHSKGYGLGLTLVRQLAELMGGEVVVQSKPGRGSRFQVKLPLIAPPE